MVNTKTIILLIALSVVVALIAGIAFSQLASAQSNTIGQTAQRTNGAYPKQGCYSYGSGLYGKSYGYGRGIGMGMCRRFW